MSIRKTMSNLDASDMNHKILNSLMYESLHIHSHLDFMLWLQSDFQKYITHEVMIAAWGDFSLGIIYVDIVSVIPGARTGKISSVNLTQLLQRLFENWKKHDQKPFSLSFDQGVFHDHELGCIEANINLKMMKSAFVHGIKDFRGGHDCLYVFISSANKMPILFKKAFSMLLTFIDCTLRQLEHLPQQLPRKVEKPVEVEIVGTLSDREEEIMAWVKIGKTNQDIALILDISPFTVKNHLQRIFKKLDVLNRAQAVTYFNRMYQINDSK